MEAGISGTARLCYQCWAIGRRTLGYVSSESSRQGLKLSSSYLLFPSLSSPILCVSLRPSLWLFSFPVFTLLLICTYHYLSMSISMSVSMSPTSFVLPFRNCISLHTSYLHGFFPRFWSLAITSTFFRRIISSRKKSNRAGSISRHIEW